MNGVFVDYFDIAYESCKIDKGLEQRLGYKKILISGVDVKVIDGNHYKKSDLEDGIFVNAKESNLIGILNMSPSAIVFPDSRINKKALEQMKEREIALCIQLSNLTMSYGLQRSRNLYMASKLFDYAKGMEIDVCFASFARTNVQLCSYIQIIELARLLGADEEYAKKSLSMNGSLAIE